MYLAEYETTMVVRPDIGGDSIEATLDRVREVVRASGGKLIAINHWGKKKLAYEINKQTRGIYIHTHYLGGSSLVAEIERNLRISENVMRYLTVRLADKVTADSREEKEYVRPQYDSAEMQAIDETDFDAADDDQDRDHLDADDLDVSIEEDEE